MFKFCVVNIVNYYYLFCFFESIFEWVKSLLYYVVCKKIFYVDIELGE